MYVLVHSCIYCKRFSLGFFYRRLSQSVDYVIARALAAGIQKMVVTGNRLNASRSAIVMAKTRPNILYAAVGIHPHFVKDEFSERTLEALKELVNSPEVVCVGEIGLDFNRDFSPRDEQKKAFEKQVSTCLFPSFFNLWLKNCSSLPFHLLHSFSVPLFFCPTILLSLFPLCFKFNHLYCFT